VVLITRMDTRPGHWLRRWHLPVLAAAGALGAWAGWVLERGRTCLA
jgi:hypothetical protein